MKKLNMIKKTLSTIIAPLVMLPFASFSLSSCDNGLSGNIESINLSVDQTYVIKGSRLQIKKDVQPYSARNKELSWNLLVPIQGVTITNDGLLIVDNTFDLDYPIETLIYTYDVTNKTAAATISITICPNVSSDLLGFMNGNVSYTNRYGDLVNADIIKTGNNEYTVAERIDCFVPPKGASSSIINFTPVFTQHCKQLMRFHLTGGSDATHAIRWAADYDDNSWTSTIPSFSPLSPPAYFDTIEVSFACDPNIKLFINVQVWQQKELLTSMMAEYIPDVNDVDDQHDISIVVSEGDFSTSFFYKNDGKEEYCTDMLSCVRLFRHQYEYLDFDFAISFDHSLIIDESVRQAIEPQITTEFDLINSITKTKREYDGYPFYEINNFSLKFDSETFNPEKWGSSPVALFTIVVKDKLFRDDPESVAGTMTFYVSYI